MKSGSPLLSLARTLAVLSLVAVGSVVLQGEDDCDGPDADDWEGPIEDVVYDFVYFGDSVAEDDPVTGTTVFADDGTFEDDATHPTDGHYLSGGTWSEDADGKLVYFSFSYYQYDGEDQVDYEGATMTCDWDPSAPVITCTDPAGWTKEIQNP